MFFGLKRFNIGAPFATRQCGHLSQVEKIDTYHDALEGRAFYIADAKTKVLHVSLDLLAFDEGHRNALQEELRKVYGTDLHLVTSCTHTHYGNDVNDEAYQKYLMEKLLKELSTIEIKDVGMMSYDMKTIHYDEVGRSRISGYESHNEYLTLIRLYASDKELLDIIVYNCHPTILEANVPYFSSEFPGYVLKRLSEEYPNAFTYMSGAMGDISTRFTRSGQDYKALVELADKLYHKVKELKDIRSEKKELVLSYDEKVIEYHHTFDPIDLTKIRSDLSARELETIKFGEIMRSKLDRDLVNKSAILAKLSLGKDKILFYPNEIFSAYLDHINKDDTVFVSYSNGYGPYILPLDFPYITYEMFTDTLDRDTKERIIKALKEA